MAEYLYIRNIAIQNNDSIGNDHPCKKGKGDCCEPTVPIVDGDKRTILDAVRRGRISSEIVADAKRRVGEGTNKCGFLTENNECSIHGYHPIICLATGALAVPKDSKAGRKLMQPNCEGLYMNELTSTMCRKCHVHEISVHRGVNKTALLDSQELLRYMAESGTTPINDFIRDEL